MECKGLSHYSSPESPWNLQSEAPAENNEAVFHLLNDNRMCNCVKHVEYCVWCTISVRHSPLISAMILLLDIHIFKYGAVILFMFSSFLCFTDNS